MKKRVLAAVLGLIVTVAIPFVMELAIPEPVKELKTILRDIQDMGYTLEDAEFLQKGDAEFTPQISFLASSLYQAYIQPGDMLLNIYQYESEEELEKGAEQFSRFLTMVSLRGPLDFYRTSRNFIVCGYRSGQAEFYEPVQEYLKI